MPRASLCFLFSVCLVFVSGASLIGCGGKSSHSWSGATGAEQFERLMWQAIQKKDWNEVQAHLAPIFVGVNTSGQSFGREDWVERWKAAQVQDFSMGEATVHPNGADMVVTYTLHLNWGDAGHPFPANGARVVSVWQQLKKGWALTAQSATPIL
ncbi:MAG TPA: nuclear transport factor 2 family protein [Candidatus Angelobacter sp.]|nr:nuclear transport factor 2 family protein [Candidatus Angelobacter sp.]